MKRNQSLLALGLLLFAILGCRTLQKIASRESLFEGTHLQEAAVALKAKATLTACFVLLAVVLSCKQLTPTMTAPTRSSAPDFTVTATDLSKEFETNSSAANAKYRGKTVAVNGGIDVWARWMGLAVMFQTPREGRTIRCSFAEKDRDSFRQVYQLKVSEKVTLVGYCKGAQTDLPVEIVDCAVR